MSIKILLEKPVVNPLLPLETSKFSNYILESNNKIYKCKELGKGCAVILNDGLETSLLRI